MTIFLAVYAALVLSACTNALIEYVVSWRRTRNAEKVWQQVQEAINEPADFRDAT